MLSVFNRRDQITGRSQAPKNHGALIRATGSQPGVGLSSSHIGS